MNKEQQIEEMARVACEHFDCDMVGQPCTKCKTYDKHCYTIHQAEILYNAGYRKIDENCAVITKAELKEYKRQAVKEFADKVKEYINNKVIEDFDDSESVQYYTIDLDEFESEIDELLKEYEQ